MDTKPISAGTETIEYNYGIAIALYDKVGEITKGYVYNYIKQLVISQVKLLQIYFEIYDESVIAKNIKNIMFKTNVLSDVTKITVLSGATAANTTRETSPISEGKTTPTEITAMTQIYKVIDTSNIRELMTMIKNFGAADNDCNMYSLLVEYDKYIKPTINNDGITEFKTKYPMLNTETMEKGISLIENIILPNFITSNNFRK